MIDNLDNSWKGFIESRVIKVEQEDKNVKSFYLKRNDGGKLPKFTAGQFIAVRIKNEDGSYTKVRQYTLSKNYNEEFYRISVKRESEGDVSKRLCDEVKENSIIEITAPVGRFVLKENEKPIVLIGGGIGITPMITMAYEAIKQKRRINFIYSIPNSKNHSFKNEINELCSSEYVNKTIIYTRPMDFEKESHDYDLKGRINKEWMEENLPKDGEYYFCGPVQFMKSIYENLKSMGIKEGEINYEMFDSKEKIGN